jgi:hypothetical protein
MAAAERTSKLFGTGKQEESIKFPILKEKKPHLY